MDSFSERARHEAARYGADEWVFVRELLQNARDAGASRVLLEVETIGGCDRIRCRDDGEGMTFEHARHFLFTLYASSKKGDRRTAGRFGIGFWSVLRFSPASIEICSQPTAGRGWRVKLNEDLEVVERGTVQIDRGTEILLERPATDENLDALVRAAVLRDAPFLNRSGRGERPLEVLVNGRRIRAEPELPPPSMVFRRRGFRGVVGLGTEPRVEVFGHGLKVRDASSLDELLLTGRNGPSALPPTGEGLSPCAVIDSRRLSVLMARGDARDDRALRQLVAVGHRELRTLIRRELNRHTQSNLLARAWYRLLDAWSASRFLRVSVGGIALVFLLGMTLAGVRWWVGPAAGSDVPLEPVARRMDPDSPRPYAGLDGRYRGPDVDTLGNASSALEFDYRPASSNPLFGALTISGLAADGAPIFDDAVVEEPYEGRPCLEDCLEVELIIERQRGLLRLPVAAGHLLDPDSVRLDDQALVLRATTDGRPAVLLEGLSTGRLRYRSSPGEDGAVWERGSWPELPHKIQRFAVGIGQLPTGQRALAAADFVRRQVRYDISGTTALLSLEARNREPNFFARTLEVAAGDCDVQNAMVAALLDEAGVPARLVVGWIGSGGRVLPGLHAWVEYPGDDGRREVVDASAGSASVKPVPSIRNDEGRVPSRLPVSFWVMLFLAATAGGGVSILLLIRSRNRAFSRGTSQDIADLVRGAAIRPEAFGGVHTLFSRPLVPLLDGSSISLRRARDEVRKGRLAVGSGLSNLASRAAAGGGSVVDGERAEGAAAADALGAVDLDRWQTMLDRSLPQAVADRVEEALHAVGEPCRLRVARSVGEEIAVLDGRRFGLGRSDVWVIADHSGDAWRAVRTFGDHLPAQAALLLGEAVVERLGVPEGPRSRCLAGLARAALLEQAEL